MPDRLPQSQTEWAQLLESQQKYHDSELQKWREIIKSSVMLLDQVRPQGQVLLWLEALLGLPTLQPSLLPLQAIRCVTSTALCPSIRLLA